jgi:hypothetical protein
LPLPVRKVLIATPAYDGRLDVWYTTSLVNAVRVAQANDIYLHPVFMSYDALIQRARNDLFRLAVEGEYDDMIFIDSDIEFDPMWIMELLSYKEDIVDAYDVVGGTYRKKTDSAELYAVKTENLVPSENGLIEVKCLGTGFVKLSRKAFMALWGSSEKYQNEGREGRMVCDVKVIDGELVSEDNVMFIKLRQLGFKVWLASHMTCVHVGTKKFYGNFDDFVKRLMVYEKAA